MSRRVWIRGVIRTLLGLGPEARRLLTAYGCCCMCRPSGVACMLCLHVVLAYGKAISCPNSRVNVYAYACLWVRCDLVRPGVESSVWCSTEQVRWRGYRISRVTR